MYFDHTVKMGYVKSGGRSAVNSALAIKEDNNRGTGLRLCGHPSHLGMRQQEALNTYFSTTNFSTTKYRNVFTSSVHFFAQ